MINNNASPSKSEIISLSFSNSINADLVMLSDETATSKNYIKILKWLSNFLGKNINNKPTQKDLANKNLFIDLLKNIKLSDLVLFTKKGYIVDNITRINKNLNLHVFSDNKQVVNKCSFRANVNAILTKRFPKKMENFIYKKIKNYKRIIFKNFDKVFLVYANYPIKGSSR
jgi:pyruvate kinase